jgi:hypothetical protein
MEKKEGRRGMWMKKSPFKFSGSLKFTPEQAKKMFGFTMREGAVGITFVNFPSGKTLIKNKMPIIPFRGEKQSQQEILFSIVGKIASAHLKDIVRPIWGSTIDEKGVSGQNLFIKSNMDALMSAMKRNKKTHKKKINKMTFTKWELMQVSSGRLEKPIIKIADYYFSTGKRMKLIIKNPNKYEVGICLFDRTSFELTHIPPVKYETPIYLNLKKTVHLPIVYVYFRRGNEYSDSRGMVPRSVKG